MIIQGKKYKEIGDGVYVAVREEPIAIRAAKDSVACLAHIIPEKQEIFCVISLNGAHEVIKCHEITRGLVNESMVHPREVFAVLIEDRATSFIAAHNHPSGNLDPSEADKKATKHLSDNGKMMRIPMLDHVIVSSRGFTSIREGWPELF